MVDVKDLLKENMKEFVKEIAVSVKSNIADSKSPLVVGNQKINSTPNSQMEPITKNT